MTSFGQLLKEAQERIERYNGSPDGGNYNTSYNKFALARSNGIEHQGGLSNWLNTSDAAKTVYTLMKDFGMDQQGSKLRCQETFHSNLKGLIESITGIDLLEQVSYNPESLYGLVNISRYSTVIQEVFDYCGETGRFSKSGGFVIASKVAHSILPDVFPIIDGEHIGIRLYEIPKHEYQAPGGNWFRYLGKPTPSGVKTFNPSPRGAGRKSWDSFRYLCAIGFYARFYQCWLSQRRGSEVAEFVMMDPNDVHTGIPRVIDKIFFKNATDS